MAEQAAASRTAGCLYVVGTPLGNLEDLSPRGARVLATVDMIACEDTRSSQRILQHIGVFKPLMAYHEHNETRQAVVLADMVQNGSEVAIITDAGMPAISDPGFRVVRECRRRGLAVVPIPGPVAAATVLAASGLPSDGFLFLGFLPAKTSARVKAFSQYKEFPHTLIFYESTHRILAFVDDLISVLGPQRTICVGREVTKMHETFLTGRAADVAELLRKGSTKGEFVVCVAKEGYLLDA